MADPLCITMRQGSGDTHSGQNLLHTIISDDPVLRIIIFTSFSLTGHIRELFILTSFSRLYTVSIKHVNRSSHLTLLKFIFRVTKETQISPTPLHSFALSEVRCYLSIRTRSYITDSPRPGVTSIHISISSTRTSSCYPARTFCSLVLPCPHQCLQLAYTHRVTAL